MLNFTPTWQQEQLLGLVQRGDRQIAVRSGKGPGKTTATIPIAMWRCIQDVNALTLLTAPTMRQCREVWLGEARRMLPKADGLIQRLFTVTQSKIELGGNPDWGVKTVTATQEENAQGFHEKNMTVIFEECSGINRALVQQFEGTASNPNALLLAIGNPNTRDCSFFDFFTSQKDYWTPLHWNAEETPASEYFDPSRNTRIGNMYGYDSDIYRIQVQGEFPSTDPSCVLSSEMLQQYTDRKLMVEASLFKLNGKHVKQFGIDYARFGGDENTLYRRSGNAIVEWDKYAHTDPADVTDKAFLWQKLANWKNEDCMYVPDATGMGQGMMHMFYRAGKRVLEFNNGGSAANSTEYDNLMTEAIFGFKDKMAAGEKIYIPADPILLQQLSTRQYHTTKKGRLIVESKQDYMDRGHNSPDRADGFLMAMYDQAIARSQITQSQNSKRIVGRQTLSRIG